MNEPRRPEPVRATAASLLLRSSGTQVPGSHILFVGARLLRQGLDRETVVMMICLLLDLTDPDPELVAQVLRQLPLFPETQER